MFDGATPIHPAFFEFFSPVFFDGIGYVDKVALLEEFAGPDSPAVAEYVSASDGYLFRLRSGAHTCVAGANVKFLAGKLAGVVDGARDGKEEGVGGKGVTDHASERDERQADTHAVPSKSATPAELPGDDGSATKAPNTTKAPVRGQPKRRGAW